MWQINSDKKRMCCGVAEVFCFCNSPKWDISSCGSCQCHVLLIFKKPSQKIPPQCSLTQLLHTAALYKAIPVTSHFLFPAEDLFLFMCLYPKLIITVTPPPSSSNIMFQVSSYPKLDCTRLCPTHTKQEPFKNKALQTTANTIDFFFPKVLSKQ